MEDDQKLRDALQKWEVSGAPESLDARVRKFRRPWWEKTLETLLTGSIRIPIPVGLAIAAALVAMAVALVHRPAQPAVAPSISLTDFHPVSDLNVRVIHGHDTN